MEEILHCLGFPVFYTNNTNNIVIVSARFPPFTKGMSLQGLLNGSPAAGNYPALRLTRSRSSSEFTQDQSEVQKRQIAFFDCENAIYYTLTVNRDGGRRNRPFLRPKALNPEALNPKALNPNCNLKASALSPVSLRL